MYPNEEETALWVALNLAQRSVYRALDQELKAQGLPPLRWYDVLWAIERADKSGLRAFEIKRRLLFDQSNLSRLLRQMVQEGLVDETVFEEDRRGKTLRITAKGRKVRKQMWKLYGPRLGEQMRKVSETGAAQQVTDTLDLLCPPDVFEL